VKNKIIACWIIILAFVVVKSSLQAAAEAVQPKTELTESQKNAAVELAAAIIGGDKKEVERIFNENFVEGLLLYDNPATAINYSINITKTVQEALKKRFHDESLRSLRNSAGVRFTQLMQEYLRALKLPQQPEAGQYEKFEVLPDLVLSTIAKNLLDNDLAQFGKTSKRMYKIAQEEFAQRPGGLWAFGQVIPKIIPAHTGPVAAVFVSKDGKIISIGQSDKLIKIWDGQTYALIKQITDDANAPVQLAAFSPVSNMLALYSRNETINVWNVQTFAKINNINSDEIYDLIFSPDGTTLAASAYLLGDGVRVIVWDVRTGEQRQFRTGYLEPCLSLAFSPDGKILAVLEKKPGPVTLWDIATQPIVKLKTFEYTMEGQLAFLPDGKLIVYFDNVLPIRFFIYGIATGKMLTALKSKVSDYAIGPKSSTLSVNGNLAAVGGSTKTLIWGIKRKYPLKVLDNKSPVYSIRFSGDATMLVAGCTDGSVIVWKVKLGE